MFFARCFISNPLESRVQKHCSWTNWFSFCVCGEKRTCLKDRLNRAREWWITRAGNSFAVEKNYMFLGKQPLGFPVGCALAVSFDGLMPSDLPSNSPCSEGLSWVKAPGRKLLLFMYTAFVPRSHSQEPHWTRYTGNMVQRQPFPYTVGVK